MNHKAIFLLLLFLTVMQLNLSAWTSSNEGVCYTMDTLVQLSADITYNSIDQMFEVDCDIIILENDTLRILAGETVKFFSYAMPYTVKRGIRIFGCLIAKGESDKRIHLGDPEATFDPGSGHRWNGIEFYNTSTNGESVLKYCTLRAGTHLDEFKETAIFCENSSPIIDHCTIKYMGTGVEEYGCSAVGIKGLSYPIISYCTFEKIMRGIAVWCSVYGFVQDTLNYPSPLIYGCNILSNVQSFSGGPCDYDIVILYGGFLDNCYLGFWSYYADTTLGNPIDTIGDGICATTSTNELQQKYYMVDGVVNPRGDTLLTGMNEQETEILPTTTHYLKLENNYPNPFSRSTTIQFEVHKPHTAICLYIYDSKGNLVNKLAENKVYDKGRHEVVWEADGNNGESVLPGIYFYKLISNGQMLVKKAMLVKS